MSQEISREALLIYLENVKILETLLAENREKIPRLEGKKNRLKLQTREFAMPVEPSAPEKPVPPSFTETANYKGITVTKLSVTAGIICFMIVFFKILTDEAESAVKLMIFAVVISVIGLIIDLIRITARYNKEKELYGQEYSEYIQKQEIYHSDAVQYQSKVYRIELAKKEFEAEARNNLNSRKQEITDIQQEIRTDISALENDLQNAYSANIIPLQFRNIQGVYYLYDYLSTSNESLTSALMQANLEAIKQKLDKLIALQGEMIIRQAQANQILFEQNQKILEKDQQILETAQGIENNTFVAAQYAKISAVNSTVSLRLQEEQLAYQNFALIYIPEA